MVRWNVLGSVSVVISTTFIAQPSSAQSDRQVLERLDRLEAENQALRERVGQLEAQLGAPRSLPIPAQAVAISESAPQPTAAAVNVDAEALTWTGAFFGLSVGRNWSRSRGSVLGFISLPGEPNTRQPLPGVSIEGRIGGDLQVGHIVAGGEVALGYDLGQRSMTAVGNSSTAGSCFVGPGSDTLLSGAAIKQLSCNGEEGPRVDVTARLGYSLLNDRFLVFGRGGVSLARLALAYRYYIPATDPNGPFSDLNSGDARSMIGLAIGGGAEYRFTRTFSLGLDYLHRSFGDRSFGNGAFGSYRQFANGSVFPYAFQFAPSLHDRTDDAVSITLRVRP